MDRGGYRFAGTWETGVGGTFDRIRDEAGRGITSRGRLGAHWRGNWINAYEGRIYPRGAVPTAAELATPSASGAIEFIAVGFERIALDRARFAAMVPTAAPSAFVKLWNVGGARRDRFATAFHALKAAHGARMNATRYGRDSVRFYERVTGHGARSLRRLAADPAVKFAGDGDVVGTAWLFQELYGVPMATSLRHGGALASRLSRPWDGKAVRRLTGTAIQKEAQIFRTLDRLTGDDGSAVAQARAQAEQRKKAKKKSAEKASQDILRARLAKVQAERVRVGQKPLDAEFWQFEIRLGPDEASKSLSMYENRLGLKPGGGE